MRAVTLKVTGRIARMALHADVGASTFTE